MTALPISPATSVDPRITLTDGHGRRIEYLRISVTDRCNFRCIYCMPEKGMTWIPRESVLSFDEITAVVRELAPLGLRRIRISGGEPTLRPDLAELVAMLRAVPGIEDIALSTNGVKLAELAPSLRAAGLDRVNVSVDSLRPDRIASIARRNLAFDPLAALEAASAAGLDPIKLNVVVIRGVNDDEVADIAALTIRQRWHVRFIELMPVGEIAETYGAAALDRIVPATEVLVNVARRGPLVAADSMAPRGNGPARYFRFAHGVGTIGVITPMSHTYCDTCNRVRLTADGKLRTCLFGDHEVDLRTPLRAGEPLDPYFRQALADKPRAHALHRLEVGGLRALSEVGG